MTLDELLALRDADVSTAAAKIGADPATREPGEYESLTDVDLIDSPGDAMMFVRDDGVKLIYVGADSLPDGVDHESLAAAVGSTGEVLRSPQGKRAHLHVVAERGIAWSEQDGEVGFVEVFRPTDFETYQRDVYEDPGRFVR